MANQLKCIAVAIATFVLANALCYWGDLNIFGGYHVVAKDTTYSYDTIDVMLPPTEPKDIVAQKPDTVLIRQIIERWRLLGYDTTFIAVRDTIIERIERDPFALVLAFNDSLRWYNRLNIITPDGTAIINDTEYVRIKGNADFLSGIVHFEPITMTPFKTVSISTNTVAVQEKRDWITVALFAQRGLIGDQDLLFGAKACVHLGDVIAYITGNVGIDGKVGSDAGAEFIVFRR